MKTLLQYYGGKATMLDILLPLIPEHEMYVEPFIGGGSVFWAKPHAKCEVINDKNDMIVNFYRVVKTDFDALKREVCASLHSRSLYTEAREIYANPENYDAVKKAWAVWFLAAMSYGHSLTGSFGYSRDGEYARKLCAYKEAFTAAYARRLERVTIENNDAVKIIKAWDAPHAFFYLDPPYVGAVQGHYAGYSQEEFNALLDVLDGLRGKFLMSSYANERLEEHAARNGWQMAKVDMRSTACVNDTRRREKTEVLTANYPISVAAGGRVHDVKANYRDEMSLFY